MASLPLYSRQFPQVRDDSIVLLKSFEIDSVSAISQENIPWLIIIAKCKVQMNLGCLVLSLSGSSQPLQQGDGEPVDLGWSPTFRILTLREQQAPSSGVRRARTERRHCKWFTNWVTLTWYGWQRREGSVEMNTIRFIQPCSRDCSVQLTAHGAAGEKNYLLLNLGGKRWVRLWNKFEAHI